MCLSSMTERKNGCLAERNSNCFASMCLGTPAIWFEMTPRNFLLLEHEPKQQERSLFSLIQLTIFFEVVVVS